MSYHVDSTGTTIVSDTYAFLPIAGCPLGYKVWLQGVGGQAMPGVLKTEQDKQQWKGWAPYPRGLKDREEQE